MGIWSQDQQPSVETVIAEARQIKQNTMLAKAAKEADPYEGEVRRVSADVTPVATNVVDTLNLDPWIPAGFYRAVNHKGDAKLIRILETAENRDSDARDFYTHESEGKRWYLIRLSKHAIAAQEFQTIH